MAIRTVLASLQEHAICRYEVKSALDTSDFNGAIKNGTHEAGDFLVQMRGFSLLLDAKSTSVHSTYNPSERDQADVGREVLGKCARFHQAYGRFPDAFIFVTSGWDYQDAWLTEDVPGCVPIFHMDACTSMSAQRMNVEFDKTLQEITGVLESMRSQSDNQA